MLSSSHVCIHHTLPPHSSTTLSHHILLQHSHTILLHNTFLLTYAVYITDFHTPRVNADLHHLPCPFSYSHSNTSIEALPLCNTSFTFANTSKRLTLLTRKEVPRPRFRGEQSFEFSGNYIALLHPYLLQSTNFTVLGQWKSVVRVNALGSSTGKTLPYVQQFHPPRRSTPPNCCEFHTKYQTSWLSRTHFNSDQLRSIIAPGMAHRLHLFQRFLWGHFSTY